MKKQLNNSVPWETMFRALRAFRKTHGHCDVPRSERGLYLWLREQRRRYLAGTLSSIYYKLKDLGALPARTGASDWSNEIWDDQFDLLKQFKKRYGHCQVPRNWIEDVKLANWVNTHAVYVRQAAC